MKKLIRSLPLLLLLSARRPVAAAPAPASPTDSLRRVLTDVRQPDTARAKAAAQLGRVETDQVRALALFRQALELLPSSAERLRMNTLGGLAVAQGKTGDQAGALRTMQQQLALAKRLHQPASAATALRNMGVVAESLGDMPAAIRYFERALAVPQLPLADRLVTQATLSQALAFSEQPDGPAQAERLILRTLADAAPAYAAGRIPRTTYNTAALMAGRMLLENDHAASGVALARRELTRLAPVLAATPTADDLNTAADLRLTLADGLLMQEQYPAAAREALVGLALMRRARLPLAETDLLPVLVESLEKAGDVVGALRYQRRLGHLKDSLAVVGRTQEAQRLQTQFETREKEARIRLLAQRAALAQAVAARQQQRIWGLAAVLLAVLAGAGAGAWLFARLRRSQQRLQRLTQLKDQLFAIIGHDLRAPVAGFRQVVPMLYGFADHPDPAEQRELARSIDQTSAQLAGLLDNLLHWGRMQTQALTVHAEPVSLENLLFEEVRLAQPLAIAKQVRLRVEVPPGLPLARTDATLLRVVVRNLLMNAIKYTRPEGLVTLGAEPGVPAGSVVWVRDTGVGMSADTLAAVLSDTGARRSRRGTAGEAGTGLGLRVSRAFVQELGATLTADSRPGAGTTFRVALP